MKNFDIIGYFVDVNGDMSNPADVFIAIEEDNTSDIIGYCPIGQHVTISRDYISECQEITKDEYMQAAKGYYTPKEYLV